MSLHDVDKDTIDRSSPQPNSSDGVGERHAHQTISSAYATDTSTLGVRMVFKNNMLVTYDANNLINSVYGYVTGVSTTTPVFIIAKAGYDVFTDVLGIARPSGL